MSCLSSRVLPARQVPTSPRREASLFHLPDLAVRHFLWRHRRGTRRSPSAGTAVGWINKEIDQDRVLSASSDATGGRGVVHAYPDQGSPPRDGIGGGRAGEQRLLHQAARAAPRQEDSEFRRARCLSPLLRR